MIDADGIRSIISTYQKYDWLLRRVLLTPSLNARLQDKIAIFGETPVCESGIDAAWFSRPATINGPNEITWELRYLGEPAFALLAKTDESDPDFEGTLSEVEQRLRDSVRSKKGA
jgi:hypothetical protein